MMVRSAWALGWLAVLACGGAPRESSTLGAPVTTPTHAAPRVPDSLTPATVGDALVPTLRQLATLELDAQIEIVHSLSTTPTLPAASELMSAAAQLEGGENGALRRHVYRALLRLPDADASIAALRARRPAEHDRMAGLTADLVAAYLGGAHERARVRRDLASIDLEDVPSVMEDVYAVAKAPSLAPLFGAWLDDQRIAGVTSHRRPVSLRVSDHGVWAIIALGVDVEGAPASLVTADDRLREAARRAIAAIP
jgi:hypothetical protein